MPPLNGGGGGGSSVQNWALRSSHFSPYQHGSRGNSSQNSSYLNQTQAERVERCVLRFVHRCILQRSPPPHACRRASNFKLRMSSGPPSRTSSRAAPLQWGASPGEFSTGYADCCDDFGICCKGCCCPCELHGDIKEHVRMRIDALDSCAALLTTRCGNATGRVPGTNWVPRLEQPI